MLVLYTDLCSIKTISTEQYDCFQGANKVVELAGPSIKSTLENNPGYDLKVTGHSLGAGTAELVTMSLLSEPDNTKYIPPCASIKCIVLAPPPIFRTEHNIDKR